MGVSSLDEPSVINIYPKDFEAKEKISDLITEYNKGVKDTEKITYTDYIGLMLSSVTTIINAISYILIAFVSISLIVSSIMIGIITYISVLERTKEIGVLRAMGASKKDVSRVFNAETLIVGFAAGAIGILITLLLLIPDKRDNRRRDRYFGTCGAAVCGRRRAGYNKHAADTYIRLIPVKSGGEKRPRYRTSQRVKTKWLQNKNCY